MSFVLFALVCVAGIKAQMDAETAAYAAMLRAKKEKRWPPDFESSGGSYNYDTNTGLFYEPHTSFYYDSSSKVRTHIIHHHQDEALYFNLMI